MNAFGVFHSSICNSIGKSFAPPAPILMLDATSMLIEGTDLSGNVVSSYGASVRALDRIRLRSRSFIFS